MTNLKAIKNTGLSIEEFESSEWSNDQDILCGGRIEYLVLGR